MPSDETNTGIPSEPSGSHLVRLPTKAEAITYLIMLVGVLAQLVDAFPDVAPAKINACLGMLWITVRMYAMVTGRTAMIKDTTTYVDEASKEIKVFTSKRPL